MPGDVTNSGNGVQNVITPVAPVPDGGAQFTNIKLLELLGQYSQGLQHRLGRNTVAILLLAMLTGTSFGYTVYVGWKMTQQAEEHTRTVARMDKRHAELVRMLKIKVTQNGESEALLP